MIDRIAPTHRPNRSVAGYQRWRSLLFLHWRIPAQLLQPLVPTPLEIDTYEKNAYIAIVPFLMEGVRPFWWPDALAFQFLETNLRTYVVHNGQPGVYFLSMEANSYLAVQTAKFGWGLPYHFATMHFARNRDEIRYDTRRVGSWAAFDVRYEIGAELSASQPDTLEHFLFERYLLFVKRGRALYSGQVHHKPYPIQSATVRDWHDSLVPAMGLPALATPPPLAHYSSGVDVEVFPLIQSECP